MRFYLNQGLSSQRMLFFGTKVRCQRVKRLVCTNRCDKKSYGVVKLSMKALEAGRCMANSGKTEAEEKIHDKRLAQITSRKVLNRKSEILLSRYFASLWPRGKNEDYNLWLFYFKQLKNCYWACQYTPMQCKNSISALHASCQQKLFVI